MTTRADFLVIVRRVSRRQNLPESAVIAAMASLVERNASLTADPALTHHLDQVAAALAAEIGPSLKRDISGGAR